MTRQVTTREKYLEQLVLSLRVRDFSAERIRETLAEVEAHLDAGGEEPYEAFGEPSEFAASLDHARSRPVEEKRSQRIQMALVGLGALVAVLLALNGVSAMVRGGAGRDQRGRRSLFCLALVCGRCCLAAVRILR